MSDDPHIVRWHYPAKPGSLYQPSNGTEGEVFFSIWCENCARDKVMNGEARTDAELEDPDNWCPIIARTMAYNTEDAEYPREWRIAESGQPECTAYVPFGEPIPAPRDELTLPLFPGNASA